MVELDVLLELMPAHTLSGSSGVTICSAALVSEW